VGDTYVVDMRHYLDGDSLPAAIPAPARRLAEHFGRIVGAATARPAGQEFTSPVPCRRRPGRRACPGPIRIRRSEVPPRIEWLCAACHDGGLISGFTGTPWDLSRVPPGDLQGIVAAAKRSRRSAASGRRKPASAVHQLKITLGRVRPPIWRRVQVPSDLTLARLHDVVQDVMGWTDTHLHSFDMGGEEIGIPSPEDWRPVRDERRVRLADVLPSPKERALYTYDFGDDWEHAIVVEKILAPEPGARYPVCLAGRRACPPEDVGGAWRYAEMLAALEDPSNPEREEYLEWLGRPFDPEAFDPDEVNGLLRRRFK